MPNYRRYYISHAPVFVTVVTKNRTPWLIDHVDQLLNAMSRAKQKYPYKHIAHVILPDHFHWLFEMLDEDDFSKLVSFVKRDLSWRLKHHSIDAQWQNRFYDHVIRDEDDLNRHVDYIHFNPVKHGLVLSTDDYRHSSFSEWQKRGRYESGWGSCEPESIKVLDLD